jgi:hypothetical protein
VVGLAVGKQTLVWWRAEQARPGVSAPAVRVADALGDPRFPHSFEFGGAPWLMRRVACHGDETAAGNALVAAAEATVEQASILPTPPSKAEQALLDQVAKQPPMAERPGQWQVFRVPGPFPLVVGTRGGDNPHTSEGKPVAGSTLRVVTWGVAAPVADGVWSVYTFWPAGHSIPPSAGVADVPLPPGCTRVLCVQVEGGGRVTTFHGPGLIDDWTAFYDRWFAAQRWKQGFDWRSRGQTWWTQFVGDGASAGAVVDVQFRSGDGQLQGLLISTPAQAVAGKHEP